MKVKQIVDEHKKGRKAIKHNKKPQDPAAAHLKAKEKLEPVKPMQEMSVRDLIDREKFKIMDPDEYGHQQAIRQQDREHELSIGTEQRAELKAKADELAELKRQQLRKERLEDQELAYIRAKDKAEREAEMEKIKRKYDHELNLINTEHRNNMEAIRTGNTHELDKMNKEYQHEKDMFDREARERDKDRDNSKEREEPRDRREPPKKPAGPMNMPEPEEEPEEQEVEEPPEPEKPTMWHTSQQVGYTPSKPNKKNDNDVIDVVARPVPDKPIALGYDKKDDDVKESKKFAVDKNGRTQSEWYYAVMKKYPNAKIIQEKRPNGNMIAFLPNGGKIIWSAVDDSQHTDSTSTHHQELPSSLKDRMSINDIKESRYDRRDAYQRDYDSSISGMDTSRRYREVDDEANLMYRYNTETGKLVQKMIDVRDEREAKSMGWRYEWKDALRLHNIIQSKFDPQKFVQKQGNKWVPINIFKDKPKQDDVSEGEGKVTAVDPTKGVEITNPETGVKTTLPPKMSSALAPDKANPNRYTLNPQTVTGGDEKDTATGPKVGSQVAIPDQTTEEDMVAPPADSTSPIHGGTVDGSETGNREHELIIKLLKKLAGVQEMDNGPVSVQTGIKSDLGQMGRMAK